MTWSNVLNKVKREGRTNKGWKEPSAEALYHLRKAPLDPALRLPHLTVPVAMFS